MEQLHSNVRKRTGSPACFLRVLWLVVLLHHCCVPQVEARLLNGVRLSSQDAWTVCTSPWQPFVQCTINSTDPTTFSGYGIEVFRQASLQIGWRASDYTWQCMDWLSMTADMVAPNGTCDMTAADFTYDGASLDQGLKFGYPDAHDSFSILVYAEEQVSGHWLFLQPFQWQVWVMLLVAAVLVGVSIHLVEVMSKKHTSRQIHLETNTFFGEHGWFDSMWKGMGLIVNAVDPISTATWASRLVVFVWCFMILLLLTMYTGNAAAILTARRWTSSIQTRSDLVGANFGVSNGGFAALGRLGVFPTISYPWRDNQDSDAFLEELRLGHVEALVLDTAFVQYMAAIDCNFHEVDVPFGSLNYAMTFNPSFPATLADNFSRAVLDMEQGGTLDRLRTAFLVPASSCGSGASRVNEGVTFGQVYGLWIVLAGTIAVALCLAYLKSLFNKKRRIKMLRAMPVSRSLNRRRNLAESPAGSVEINMGDKVDGGVVLSINPVAEGAPEESVREIEGKEDPPKTVAVSSF
ncbi:glutamate receptor [Klebsormidium nitens]|uniref:Glutamate receptor n=1 Tax=Klebsormidium nitens TaxID=105231 RepID=A0A1Y1HSR6_KLENI|nr:glutamate receptor [Klebsormidium nitens]|eukprot:GAQ78868.1 glutamate receptor [Klebsormidium nitens]